MINEIMIPKEKQYNEFRTRQEAKILTYIQRCQLLHLIGQSQSVESQIYLFLALFFNKHQKAASKSLTMLMDCNMLYHLIYLLLQITCTWMTSLSSGIHRCCIESKVVKTIKTPMNKQSSSNLKHETRCKQCGNLHAYYWRSRNVELKIRIQKNYCRVTITETLNTNEDHIW